MEGGSPGKKKGRPRSQDHDFAQLIFSWSLDDIHNENLHQVEKIPLTFRSEEHYFRSFVNPLLEETRTELASSMKMMYKAPFAELSSIWEAKGKEKLMYDVTVGNWRNSERRKEPYRTLPGDLLLLANVEPGSVSDLQSVGSSTWAFLLVNNIEDDDNGNAGTSVQFKVMSSQKIEFRDGMCVVFLMNITTQKRIWNSLHNHPNLDIIKEILYPDSVVKEKCDACSLECNDPTKSFDPNLVSKLNESQKAAIMASISKMDCCHKSSVEQIWGPPGTGKTMTVSVMLSIFLQMKCRTLTCAPTNVAIVAVASRVLSLLKESFTTKTASGDSLCSVGDVLLFGNKDRLKVGTNIEEIYLDHRVERLTECLTGWKHCIKSMIDLLEDCHSQYLVFVENESFKEKQTTNENKSKTKNLKVKSFLEFLRERFNSSVVSLRKCIVTFCTHIPKSFIREENFESLLSLLDTIRSLESLLSQKNLISEEVENIFDSKPLEDDDDFVRSGHLSVINSIRIKSLSLLKTLQTSLGVLKLPGGNRQAITRFCYERASLIFCTTSTSYTLQKVKMEPLKLLVIDEAAHMKECEAIIPLQIPGIRHAILIGDECQLPATVKSNVSSECGLGRSLFERLSSLGHSKHLLNVQYRMHPSISYFPNRKFYHDRILDAKNVTSENYGRQYLAGPMFGSYSFINIVGEKEEGDDVGSKRNMVEVSIVVKIVQKLYKAWQQSKKKVSIGVVSPYTAQVVSIEEKLRYKYEKCDGFSVTVKSIDGFQGGEEDIIILSTVRSNSHGSVGFISSPQRTNVALTRARHCLWILGNERTLDRSDSIWKDLVCDARNRHCLFDADSDECLRKKIIDAKKKLKHVKWKVLFSDNFRKSFGNLVDSRMKNLVVDLLQKLSGGWRPNDGNIDYKTSPKVLKTCKVEGLHVIWTTDIIKESNYIQVLKVWDILPLKEIPNLRKELDSIFATYSDDYMNRCTTKCMEGFCSLYWPDFESNLKKKLDPSRVFTEIVFHIKGGLHVGEISLLSEGHAPTLTKQKRETVNTLFQAYEKMKTERGEFDLGDLVNDLHHRLKNNPYEGDQMDFIYIDEVQDLSMRQISLFKYMCQNVEEGFNLAGDTAKNIARGIDSRLEDIRSMLYTEFSGSRTTGRQEKVHVFEIFQLKQNSRTHVGVLKLAQSVIDLLYCYFSHSIDILEPETTLYNGEAPVLLKSGNTKSAIVKIFGGTGTSEEIVGFGAEQVILVRDNYAKTEIREYVGKHALVLTIAECKGLEFQDVLLYNFFGSSPLKDEWSVIYGYMKEQDLLNEELPHSFPSFKESRHDVLCSELKQLYVAITRARQRLWICENKEELSNPMFNYWKGRLSIKVRKLNDSVARAMSCASSPQEWLERGKKLFDEKVFGMATMCFERAGDLTWKTMAEASERRTSADLRKAAEMFESIGKFELAATCYSDLGEHERGKIYMDKCGHSNAAAESFVLARCYSDAAEAYAKGDMFSNCLLVCKKGELFDKGLQYVEYWKEHVHIRSKEMEQIEQDFLESCALSYYERKDHESMMEFVRAFSSLESKRVFLRSLGCLADLLLLEEESNHFLNAAELAGSLGDVLKEASLLEKAGLYEKATLVILWYVFTNSLWGNRNTGWPLKEFAQKKELCKKAKSLSKMDSNNLHAFVCSELKVLSNRQSGLSKLKKQLHTSQQHKSLRGEFLSIRKILDAHIQTNILKYDWEDELPIDSDNHVEEKISHNRVSIRTLVFYFNIWKDNVMDIFQSLGSLNDAEPNEHEAHVDFCLNYFGVRKQCVKGNIVYLLVNKDFDWVRDLGEHIGLHREGEILTLEGNQLVLAIQSYWQSDLLSVAIKVLETLRSLYNLTLKGSAFHQSTSLLHIFEVSKFLLDCQYLNLTDHHIKTLQVYLESSLTYFDFVFPLDWRKSVSRNLIALRETNLSLNLLDEVILQNINIEGNLTYWAIGKVMMISLSSRKSVALYEKIIRGLQCNLYWKSFIEKFWEDGLNDVYVAPALQNALEDTYKAYWWSPGFMSLHSFVYLMDRLLFMASFSSGFFFTTRSSFVEWYTCSTDTMSSASKQIISKDIAEFLVGMVEDILYKKEETISWIKRSNIVASSYHPLIALKLVMIVSLVSLQLLDCSQVLNDLLLGQNNVAYLLPKKFVNDLLRGRSGCNLDLSPDMVAKAFASVEDPLLTVHSENATPRVHAPCAIYVDLTRPREEIISVLFASKTTRSGKKDKSATETAPFFREENHLKKTGDEHSNTFTSVHRGETSLPEASNSCNDLKQPFCASDTSQPEVDLLASKSGETTMQTFVEMLQSNMPLNNVGSESRNITEAFKEDNHVEETDDELCNIEDPSPLKSKKGKGKLVAEEDKSMRESNRACSEPNPPSSAFNMRIKTLDVLAYGSILCLAAAYLRIRSLRKT